MARKNQSITDKKGKSYKREFIPADEMFNRIEQKRKLKTECWEDLPKELQSMIEEGIKQAEEGKVIPYEEIRKMYPQWFRKS